jgi:hypothetical protein
MVSECTLGMNTRSLAKTVRLLWAGKGTFLGTRVNGSDAPIQSFASAQESEPMQIFATDRMV